MSQYKKTLLECKNYGYIMDDITQSLDESNINFNRNSKNELVINGKTKKEVKDVVYSLSIPKPVIKLLISITEAKSKIYIRKILN